jgi:hypothetical protein
MDAGISIPFDLPFCIYGNLKHDDRIHHFPDQDVAFHIGFVPLAAYLVG